MYSLVTSESSGRVIIDGIEASSFGLHHAAPNAFYMLHRVMYASLTAMGAAPTTIQGVLDHELVGSVNAFIGKVAISVGRGLRFI